MNEPIEASDETLIARVIERDGMALSLLYQRYGDRLYRVAYRVLASHMLAEDVLQDVFLQLWQKPGQWNADRGRLENWLCIITRNNAIDVVRRMKREPVPMSLHQADGIDNPEEYDADFAYDDPHFASHQDDMRILERLLQRLPREQRHVIYLSYFRGLTHQQMAQHLSLPLGTVKSRLRLGWSSCAMAGYRR